MTSLTESLQRLWPTSQWVGTKVVVGVSGGPDSVALLRTLADLATSHPLQLVVAHMDHGLRGAESDADRVFVETLSRSLQIPCETQVLKRIDMAILRRPSENDLRRARHRFLCEVAQKHEARWIATAHHADDVVETFLHHLIRGSGPRGLASIRPTRRIHEHLHWVRPFLYVHRHQIMEFLQANGFDYRIDRSNASNDYTRNRIRNELLPMLRSFAGVEFLDRRIANAAMQIREEHEWMERTAHDWLRAQSVTYTEFGVQFPAEAFRSAEWVVVREALVAIWHEREWPLRDMGMRHWERVRRFLDPASWSPHPRRMQLPGGIEVTMRRRLVCFSRPETVQE